MNYWLFFEWVSVLNHYQIMNGGQSACQPAGDDLKKDVYRSYTRRHTIYMSSPASRRISPYIQILPLRRSMKMTLSWWRRSLWGYPVFILFLPSLFLAVNKSILYLMCFLYIIKSVQNSSLIITDICKIYVEISQCFLYLRYTSFNNQKIRTNEHEQILEQDG